VTNGYHIERLAYRTIPSLQAVLMAHTVLEHQAGMLRNTLAGHKKSKVWNNFSLIVGAMVCSHLEFPWKSHESWGVLDMLVASIPNGLFFLWLIYLDFFHGLSQPQSILLCLTGTPGGPDAETVSENGIL
jgi:hypothetical protein